MSPFSICPTVRSGAVSLSLALATAAAHAQLPAASAGAASAPARPAPAAAAPAAPAASAAGQRIEITGGRVSDTEQRRQSTAAKIVIGRDEIDKFGDATVGEVLRRLPGVTTPGAPGRGGPPRMRGLGNGFTQLLIDGERVPPGFSLESLTPEQIERIEILRAPTAETGARAIAGTINIITREGFRRRLNEVRIGVGVENGRFSPGVNWTHNDSAGPLTYNLSGSAFHGQRSSANETRVVITDVDSGAPLEGRSSTSQTDGRRTGMNFSGRLQWRLGDSGDMLSLNPTLFTSRGHSDTRFALTQPLRRAATPEFYDTGKTVADSDFTNLRLGGQWRQRVGNVRVEIGGSGGRWRSTSESQRTEFAAGRADPLRTIADRSATSEDALKLTFKASTLTGGGDSGSGHSLVSGGEIDVARRADTRSTLQNGVAQLTDFGDELQASSLRLAAYAQDEWSVTPNWGAHAGLRWEGITTRGDAGDGSRPSNRSSVWTPLLHAVYKPDPKGRDQLRISLTRSYRSPALGSLIARPTIARDYDPATGSNRETSPDSAGNPALKPELATGIDVAIERYLANGGILSANLFHRQISNLMRGVTTLEPVSYSPFPRWVRRQRNVGEATTSGLEFEAKFRLDQVLASAPPVELRNNLSVYRSRVKSVPGPDNRLDQQASASANFGADYRFRGAPFTLGGNINIVPGYTTRLDADETLTVSRKTVWDAYLLWTISPQTALRLLGSNLDARDYATTTVNDTATASGSERTTVRSNGPSYTNWQLRLELKL